MDISDGALIAIAATVVGVGLTSIGLSIAVFFHMSKEAGKTSRMGSDIEKLTANINGQLSEFRSGIDTNLSRIKALTEMIDNQHQQIRGIESFTSIADANTQNIRSLTNLLREHSERIGELGRIEGNFDRNTRQMDSVLPSEIRATI
jgi:hypothetical protein